MPPCKISYVLKYFLQISFKPKFSKLLKILIREIINYEVQILGKTNSKCYSFSTILATIKDSLISSDYRGVAVVLGKLNESKL